VKKKKIRTTTEAIKQAIKALQAVDKNDSDEYYCVFDGILEERLKELDPEFVKAMDRWYL